MRWCIRKRIDPAYVDSSAFIAFLDRSDTYHSLAVSLFRDPPGLVTTSAVVVETHGWFVKRYDSHRALQFLECVAAFGDRLKVLPIGQSDVAEAARVLRRFHDHPLTLVDALGLWVMAHGRVRDCWSTDRHLGLTGVPLRLLQP